MSTLPVVQLTPDVDLGGTFAEDKEAAGLDPAEPVDTSEDR
jgi:hypothetical protein